MPRPTYLSDATLARASDLAFTEQRDQDISDLTFSYQKQNDIAQIQHLGDTGQFGQQSMLPPDDPTMQGDNASLGIVQTALPQLQPLSPGGQAGWNGPADSSSGPQPTPGTPSQNGSGQQSTTPGAGGTASPFPSTTGGSWSVAQPPGTTTAQPGTSASGDLEAYARSEAARLGIDPDTAVRVANTEGGFSDPTRQNTGGAPAYGPYQLYVGGAENPGLGDEALRQGIDPRNPAHARAAVSFALQNAAQNGWGAFQGAAANGIGQWDGIGQAQSSETQQNQAFSSQSQPYQASEIKQNLAKSSENTPPPSPAAASLSSGQNDVAQAALDDPDKWSLCGPVAAVIAAGRRGVGWTVAQAKRIAQDNNLWDAGTGMHGLSAEMSMLSQMGVPTHMGAANEQHLEQDAMNGNTPIISTNRHYFILTGYDPETGTFDTTTTGTALAAGARRLTLAQIEQLGGGIQGAAYMDNPASPTPSVAAPPTAGVTPAPAGSPSASAAVAPPAADAPDPLRQQLDQSGNTGPASLKQLQPDQPQDDPGQEPTGIDYSGRKPLPEYQRNPNGPIMTGTPFETINGDVPFLGTNRNQAVYGPSIQEGPEPVQPPAPPPLPPPPPEPNRAVQGEPVYDGPVDVRGFPAGSGGWPMQMYRQPLASNMGPDTTSGTDQQPYDPDQGLHEALPGSVGAGPVGPLYGPPDTGYTPPGGAQPTTGGAGLFAGTAQASGPDPSPSSPQAPSGFPGLQAVYDSAGNFLHWIQSAATGVQNQVDSQMAGPVQSTPGEPDYVPPSNPVQRWIDTPIAQPPDQAPPSDPALAAGRLYMPPYPQSLVPRDVGADMQRFGPRTLEAVREAAQAVQQSSTDTQQAISQGDLVGTIWNGAKTAIDALNVPFTGVTSSIDNALPSYDVHGTGFGTALGDAQVAADVGHALAVGIKITPKVVAALRAGVPVDRLIELAGRGLNAAADTIGRGIGAGQSALARAGEGAASADRVPAPGEMQLGSGFVPQGNPYDIHALTRAHVVEQPPQYPEGTPEAAVNSIMRQAQAVAPDGVAHVSGDEMTSLPASPFSPDRKEQTAVPGVKNSGQAPIPLNPGGFPSTDDVRAAVDAGLPHKDWYFQIADRAAQLVGPENLPEFFTIFGITSAQTKVHDNIAATLQVMKSVREMAAQGKSWPEIRASLLDKGDQVQSVFKKTGEGRFDNKGKPVMEYTRRPDIPFVLSSSDKRQAIVDAYETGISSVESGAKTSSYSGSFESAGQRVYDPRTTNDLWVWRAFNVTPNGVKAAANDDAAYRTVEAVLNEIASEQGLPGHNVQAALWATMKNLWEQAPDLAREYEQGEKTLSEVVQEGRHRTVDIGGKPTPLFDVSTGQAQDFDRPEVQRVLNGADPSILRQPGPTEQAASMTRQYAGQGTVPRPSNLPFRLQERAVAEGQAPMATLPVTPQEMDTIGLDRERGVFPWLTLPHRVVESGGAATIHLPGGNSETARYVGSLVGERLGRPATVSAPVHGVDSLAGVTVNAPPRLIQGLRSELQAAGIPHATGTTATVLQIPHMGGDPEAFLGTIQEAAARAGVPSTSLRLLTGEVSHVEPADHSGVVQALQDRYRASIPPGVQGGANSAGGATSARGASAAPGAQDSPLGSGVVPSGVRSAAYNGAQGGVVGAYAADQEDQRRQARGLPPLTPTERVAFMAGTAGLAMAAGSPAARGAVGHALGSGFVGRGQTVEALQQRLQQAQSIVERLVGSGDAARLAAAQENRAAIESQLVDAQNARRALEPRIRSEVGVPERAVPPSEQTVENRVDAVNGGPRGRINPQDLSGPVSIPVDNPQMRLGSGFVPSESDAQGDAVRAAIRAAAARGDSAEVARLSSALPEGRNVALPGMEPPPSRVTPNGPAQAVGDAAAQAEMRAGGSALPGMEAQAADRFAPVNLPPAVQRMIAAGPAQAAREPQRTAALAEMRSGGMRQPMLVPPDPASPIAEHAAAMQTAIPPNVANAVSAAQARQARTGLSPLAWIGQLVKQVSYSSLIGPTAFVAKTGGDLSMAVGAHPKELVRALGRGAPSEYGQWAAGGLDALQYDAGPAMLDAIVGRGQYGNHGGMSLSSQTQNPVGKALATLFEGGGRLFMGVPTAVFGEAARGAGERLKAAQIATDLVRSGEIPRSSWQSTIDGLVEDARAVRAGGLPSLPETHAVVQAGVDYGKRQTFQNEVGTAGQVVKGTAGIEKWPRKVETTNADGETITKRLFDQPIPGVTNYLRPIFGVPWNMHARLAESSPLGLAREGVNIVRGKGTSFDHMYDAVVGSTLMAGFGYLASQGLQTGNGPSDPKQRADLIRNGWQPYSTLVNGVYVPNKLLYGMFAPSANLAGDVHDAIAYRKPGTAAVSPEVGLGILSRTGSMLRQEAFLQPLSDALSAVGTGATQSLGAGGAAALASNIDRFIPYGSTGRVIGASQDPYARQAQGGKTADFSEQVRQRWLAGVGVRSAEPPALDQRGEPLPNPQQGVRALASRVSTPRAPDPILDDLQGRGVTLGPAREAFTVTGAGAPAPQNAPGSHEEALTPAEQQAWLRYRWQHIQQAYPVVTGDRRYQVLPDEAKKAAWENSIIPGAAQYADAMVRHDQQQQRRAG